MQPVFIEGKTAAKLYERVKDLPIIDYHCHLNPKEIFEDRQFDGIGEMFLAHDHYKWRMMRGAGVDEHYITGAAPFCAKFTKYIEALQFAAGSPLYHWTRMELSKYFDINSYLTAENAGKIFERANDVIVKEKLSPRKLIKYSRVEYIATTDDIIDSLEWHAKLAADKNYTTKTAPSFRTDNVLLIKRAGYGDYVQRLSEVSGVAINNLADLKEAVINRLDFFAQNGCRFSDVGIPFFPDAIAAESAADDTFKKALDGGKVSDSEFIAFLGNMYVFLGREYKARGIISQWHLAVLRNTNSRIFESVGPDSGVDCIGDVLAGSKLAFMLDEMNKADALPRTIIYTLNPSVNAQLVSIAGAFPGVQVGTAWWFCDHKRGIAEMINVIAEVGYIGAFLGMLTDSRSFLSYARHDYFRRILCSVVGSWVDSEGYSLDSAHKLCEKICYGNIANLIKGN